VALISMRFMRSPCGRRARCFAPRTAVVHNAAGAGAGSERRCTRRAPATREGTARGPHCRASPPRRRALRQQRSGDACAAESGAGPGSAAARAHAGARRGMAATRRRTAVLARPWPLGRGEAAASCRVESNGDEKADIGSASFGRAVAVGSCRAGGPGLVGPALSAAAQQSPAATGKPCVWVTSALALPCQHTERGFTLGTGTHGVAGALHHLRRGCLLPGSTAPTLPRPAAPQR
jgi:hypothetical protein